MIDLKDVTFLSINGSADTDMFLYALQYSQTKIKPKKSVLVSWEEPSIPCKDIEFHKIDKILSKDEYSKFLISNINKYFDTKYMLMIQDDGYILNPQLWTNEFLEYDYIGAPWPKSFFGGCHYILQGNGGFSLRSKRFVNKLKTLIFEWESLGKPPEDVFSCVCMRSILEGQGFRWAPLDIAKRFSTEWPIPELASTDGSDSFGFHCSGDFPSKINLNLAKKHCSKQEKDAV